MPMITDFTEDLVTRQACAVFSDINSADMVAFTNMLLTNPTYDYHTTHAHSLLTGELIVLYVLTEKVIN